MGIVIPVALIPREEYVRRVYAIRSEALQLGKRLIDAKELVVRPLRPRDLGLNSDEWVFSVSAGENTIVNVTLDDKTLVVIYGVYNMSTDPQVNEIIFGTPARTVDDLYIEDMYMYDNPEALIDEIIAYQPGSTVLIKAVAKASNTTEKLGFKGFVIEPAGRRIGSS